MNGTTVADQDKIFALRREAERLEEDAIYSSNTSRVGALRAAILAERQACQAAFRASPCGAQLFVRHSFGAYCNYAPNDLGYAK